MEAKAIEHVRKKEWIRAAEIYNQLLLNKHLNKQQTVAYLLNRSECFLELRQHEAVVADCRRVIRLLADRKDDNESNARRRLVYALLALHRFAEAEVAVKEWGASKYNSQCQSGEVLKLLEEFNTFSNKTKNLHNGATVSDIKNKQINVIEKEVYQMDDFCVCTYCNITFKEKMELRAHCQTESHQQVIMSDEGRDWYWRPPPRGADVYSLCESWLESGVCRFGLQCVEAHGPEELAEWKERFEYRLMKLKKAYEKELFGKSYTEELLEKWVHSTNPENVMKESLDYIKDNCSSDLITIMSTKNSTHEWEFTLITEPMLFAVALLQDTHRNHFELGGILYREISKDPNSQYFRFDLKNKQEWTHKTDLQYIPCLKEYKVKVIFKTDIYGTFRQSVVFNFGMEPVLVKHICVDVMPVTDLEKINELKKEIVLSNIDRWNSGNSNIIPFTSHLTCITPSYGDTESGWAKTLNNMYPCPRPETFALSQTTVTERKLTRHNYKARIHELLYIEEMARYEQIALYNLKARLRIAESYVLAPNSNASSTAKYSNSGELFALIKLGKDLSEDTSAGRLILNNCTSVLISPDIEVSDGKPKVYECLIEDKGKKVIYLRLSARAVADLKLISDTEFPAQVQFQLNRIPYCEWHFAVDKISDLKIIYPETYLEPNIPWSPQRQWSDGLDTRLNLKQKEAIVAITTPLYLSLPPILIIGPFGTGKTFTLAQAIKQLILQPDNRILICTHSNSAADLYIKDYLHPYVENGHVEAKPLRIYYQKRWVATVHETVQKYCLIDLNGSNRSFRIPTIEDITKHRIVVVTLSISMYLSTLGLPRGFFTHILLDEAAQAMECEAIMPLGLANESTRIVLAGDHMQLSPEIFSHFAKERNLHVSLLERLYDHYPTAFPCKILLSENYRAHEAIIQFTSESFYDQKLVACGKQPKHDVYYPLTFFTTRGEDIQDQNSTAFYNNSEVYEIVERVVELKRMWPLSWGAFDEHSIGIMTPYSDQVFRIRSELRKRRLYGISVERVLNVQGKQFRAVFLSTVRTRRTCTSSTKSADEVDYGFLSNSKLLNTAVTRAQSLVAVVGDPIALCSIGRCSKVWERFIQICNENNSLFGITWSQLRSQLDGVEFKKSYVLNPLAPEFVPKKFLMEAFIINSRVLPPVVNPQWMNNPPPIPHSMVRFPQPPPFASPPIVDPFMPVVLYPNQILQPTPHMVAVRPPLPSWPVNNVPPPQTPHRPPVSFPREMEQPNIQPPASMIPNPFPPQLPQVLHKTMPNPQSIIDPRVPPIPCKILTQGNEIIDCSRPNMQMPHIERKHEETGMIQFLNNVHFPETFQNSSCSLNDYINLLPPKMTLADMITQTYDVQESWFHHLLKTKGIEAAKKFEYLIHTTTKKEPIQNQNVSAPSASSPCKSYIQDQLPDLNWYNKPVNQINLNQPVYLLDNVAAPTRMNIRPNNEICSPNEVGCTSMPLYKRQGMPPRLAELKNFDENGCPMSMPGKSMYEPHKKDWQNEINAEFSNLKVGETESIDDVVKRYNGMTYASILRSQKPCVNSNSLDLLNIKQDTVSSNGPRLYQYFSS
ncbi:dna2/nam7 helicase family [Holotrichia oblita]|uniref:Dna2/nam7 helicase family n=1 Tax=Holotrichia oblita TaxID=644536 RepID=A0ACB9TWL5_HOLOL|nr:dna2/nam7 helicase family [Holotrichia oblita]